LRLYGGSESTIGYIPINDRFNITFFNDHSCGRNVNGSIAVDSARCDIVDNPIPVDFAHGGNIDGSLPVDFAVETIHELSLLWLKFTPES